MDVVVGIIALVAALVTVCGTIVACYAWWRGLWANVRHQWHESSPEIRRSMVTCASLILVFGAALLTVLILAPFGQMTLAYVFGGMGAFLALSIPIWAARMAWQDLHRKE